MFAQTNIQLFNQLLDEGYTLDELTLIFKAYELAKDLFIGQFRSSGKMFIAHAVGTASILGSIHAPASLVAAALTHSVYKHGDFGVFSKGVTETKRKQIRDVLGEEVEQYNYGFANLEWNRKTRPLILERINGSDTIEDNVILLRIVNELEENLDLGILYSRNTEVHRKFIMREGPLLIKMVKKLNYPSLVSVLEKTFEDTLNSEIPPELCNRGNKGVIFIPAMSYCRKWPLAIWQEFYRASMLLRKQVGKVLRRLRLI